LLISSQSCQVDYLIQTRFNTLYAVEFKFSRQPIRSGVVKQMKEKLNKLVIPKRYSYVPILVHVNGVDDAVYEADYFVEIIDFSEFISE